MPYTPKPFNPTTPYQNQVVTELNLANDNFTILSQAFLNNDPTSNPILRASYVGTTPPTNPVAGTTWLDTSTTPPTLKVYDGSNWQSNVYNSINADNSNKVGGFPASQTPAPNTILPLNASGILDLSASYMKSDIYTFRRVDLTNATSDYMLQVGEEAYISFSDATSVSLKIATQNMTLYNLYIYLTSPSFAQGNGVEASSFLLPNNTSYTNAFYRVGAAWDSNNSNYVYSANISAFELIGNLFPGNCFAIIYNEINHKSTTAISVHAGMNTYNYVRWQQINSVWNDYTTSWTSLGTITFPKSSSGFILVRRLA